LYGERKALKIAPDVWIITLNCLTVVPPTFGLVRILMSHGDATDETAASLVSNFHVFPDRGLQVAKTVPSGDLTLLKEG
jgi:hypothetical protein